VSKILFLTREDKSHIFKPPYNVLSVQKQIGKSHVIDIFTSEDMENISLCIFQYLTLYYIANDDIISSYASILFARVSLYYWLVYSRECVLDVSVCTCKN
jgi:hypothetical protein